MEGLSHSVNVYYVGAYMRLSKDDDVTGDSTSIQNQRIVLQKYCEENGFIIASEYIDDGYSGTNFNRPSFIRMLHDIENGKINCVIAKDLSRFGRNYLEVGQYLENYFPSKGIRFIAINDNVDTNKGDSDLVPFMNIFNEFHAKQTSKKLRQVHENGSAAGDCHYTYPPIGYLKNPENIKRLIPDPESSWIVERIFNLAADGMGAYSIQKWLYDHKVVTPGYREYIKWGAKANIYENAPESRRYEWGLANIKRLLSNQVYLGHTIRYKQRSLSFKNKKRAKLDQSQWSVVLNTHEPLITQEVFDTVQRGLSSRKRKTNEGEIHLFAGVARCSQCGHLLRFGTNKQREGFEYQYLYCPSVDEKIIGKCTRHYIRYDTLQRMVLGKIQEIYALANLDKKALLDKVIMLESEKTSQNFKLEKQEYNKLMARNAELDKIIPRLYEDWVTQKISEQMFSMMTSKFQQEKTDLISRLNELSSSMQITNNEEERAQKWISEIERLTTPTTLTRTMVTKLIDKIVVHEAVGPKGSRKKRPVIEIHWRFIGFNHAT